MIRQAAVLLVLALPGCAPELTPPGESTRISGRVKGKPKAPVEIHVYERCSPRFYFFERCPGKLLGEARIAKPGKFVVEVDPESSELSVLAFRGDRGSEEKCAKADVSVSEVQKPLKLKLEPGPCEPK
jgi:hypothetical protein